MDEPSGLFTIGQLSRRTGLPARTLRFWSDEGAVPPATRSASGYRLYDATGVARVELVRTLRELGLSLTDVCRVLDGSATIAALAQAHVTALDTRIRSLRVSRAVWSTVARRGSTTEETTLMNRLARLSATERARLVDDFKTEVFTTLDTEPALRERVQALHIDLPDDPTPDQVDAWLELAELLQDENFRTGLRTFLELSTPTPGGPTPPGARIWWARQVVETVAEAMQKGIHPHDPEAAELITELFPLAEERPAVQKCLQAGIRADADRYRTLVSAVQGRPSHPSATAELQWLDKALTRARAVQAAATDGHRPQGVVSTDE